jgi:hypothetical protein
VVSGSDGGWRIGAEGRWVWDLDVGESFEGPVCSVEDAVGNVGHGR